MIRGLIALVTVSLVALVGCSSSDCPAPPDGGTSSDIKCFPIPEDAESSGKGKAGSSQEYTLKSGGYDGLVAWYDKAIPEDGGWDGWTLATKYTSSGFLANEETRIYEKKGSAKDVWVKLSSSDPPTVSVSLQPAQE